MLQSEPGLGTSLTVATDTESLAEKADQSTFPRFEQEPSGSWAMRGPKNIVRTAAEFALEHRGDLSVYLGTPVEVAATLYQLGLASLSPAVRAFGGDGAGIPLVKRLALAAGPDDPRGPLRGPGPAALRTLGPTHSRRGHRCARPLDRAFGRRIVPAADPSPIRASAKCPRTPAPCALAPEDIDALKRGIGRLMEPVAETYYLEAVGEAEVIVGQEAIRITVPIRTSL